MPLKTIALAGGPILLVFLQPDAGTALVYVSVLAAVLFVSGIRWLHLALIGGVGLVAVLGVLWWLPAAGVNVLKPYQTARLTDSNSYNLTRVEDRRRRRRRARPRRRRRDPDGARLPARRMRPTSRSPRSPSSAASSARRVLLLLYLLIVWRGLKIVTTARDLFGAIVAAGIVFAFLVQVFVNVGMTMGIAPITGIPLPFISVGGSSMISNLAAVGILLSIHAAAAARGAQ